MQFAALTEDKLSWGKSWFTKANNEKDVGMILFNKRLSVSMSDYNCIKSIKYTIYIM